MKSLRCAAGLMFVALVIWSLNMAVLPATEVAGIPVYEAGVTPLVDSEYYSEVHHRLVSARKSILCTMYLAKYDPNYPDGLEARLLKDLADASDRGLEVAVILDRTSLRRPDGKNQADDKNSEAFDFLRGRGVNVSFDSDDITTHSKLLIIDGETTILGSTNWTYSALRKNHEASVIIRSRDIAREFAQAFRRVERSDMN